MATAKALWIATWVTNGYTRRINFRPRLKIGDRAAPVCDLSPWIDVSAEIASARPEIAMIVNKHNKTRRGEYLSETPKAVFLGPCKAVGQLGQPTSKPSQLTAPKRTRARAASSPRATTLTSPDAIASDSGTGTSNPFNVTETRQ